jgi:hypothetical protein
MPEPRFSSDLRLNVPWLNPNSPPFVLGFNYGFERKLGMNFEAGGIGGLIQKGYFESLMLPADTLEFYDGGRLDRYVRGADIGAMAIYRRK